MLFFSLTNLLTNSQARADSLVISSLATARSFIYKSGDPLYVNSNTTDIWRICPLNLNPSKCYPNFVQTPDCKVLTPDCRCYNWLVDESDSIIALNDCVYVQIPQPNLKPDFSLIWSLNYIYPVLPPGYISFQKLLYKELLSRTLSFDDYATVTAPLFCEAAKRQILMPHFDLCEYVFYLNISYIPGAIYAFNAPTTIGKSLLAIIATATILAYTIVYLRHPRSVKFS